MALFMYQCVVVKRMFASIKKTIKSKRASNRLLYMMIGEMKREKKKRDWTGMNFL